MDAILESAKDIDMGIAQIILVIYFCIKYINSALQKTDVGKSIKAQNHIDMEIVGKMNYYKELLNADRVLLFEFHNGQHYSSYRSALKMSPSYEVFRAGLESVRERCSNLPVSIMPKLIQQITTNGESICRDIEDIKDDMGNSYEFKKTLGIASFCDIAIRNKQGDVIGFVAVQWTDIMPDNVDLEEVKHLAWFLEEKVKELVISDKNVKKHFFGLF